MTIERTEKWLGIIRITTEVSNKHKEPVRGLEGIYDHSDIIVHTGNHYGDSIRLRNYNRKSTGELRVSESHTFTNEEINENRDCISPHSPDILNKILGHEIVFVWKPSPPSTKISKE